MFKLLQGHQKNSLAKGCFLYSKSAPEGVLRDQGHQESTLFYSKYVEGVFFMIGIANFRFGFLIIDISIAE